MAWPLKLEANQVLFHEGEESISMFLVQEGELIVTRKEGDREVILAYIHPGEMVGELSFLDQEPRSATVRAVTDCLLYQIPSRTIDEVFKTSPPWLEAFIKTMTARIRQADARIKI